MTSTSDFAPSTRAHLRERSRCLSYIGGVVAYADSNHISGTYVRSIAPVVRERLLAAVE